MPDDKTFRIILNDLSSEEAWEHRGGILYHRDTPVTRRWIWLLLDDELPDAGRHQVIILTGHQNRRLDSLGVCQEGEFDGKMFCGIFLDNPHPKEVESVNRPLSHYLRKTCTKRFLKRIWSGTLSWCRSTFTSVLARRKSLFNKRLLFFLASWRPRNGWHVRRFL